MHLQFCFNVMLYQLLIIYFLYVTFHLLKENYYIGETTEPFKKRVGVRHSTFNKIAYKNDTALAKHIWELRNRNIGCQIFWEIIDKAESFSPGDEYCQLCIPEKTWIMKYKGDKGLNSNDELISTCRHRRKYLLGRIKNTGDIDILRNTIQNGRRKYLPAVPATRDISLARRSERKKNLIQRMKIS